MARESDRSCTYKKTPPVKSSESSGPTGSLDSRCRRPDSNRHEILVGKIPPRRVLDSLGSSLPTPAILHCPCGTTDKKTLYFSHPWRFREPGTYSGAGLAPLGPADFPS